MAKFLEGFDNYNNGSITNAGGQAFSKWDNYSATIASASPRFSSNAGSYWTDSSRTNAMRNNFKDSSASNITRTKGTIGFAFNPGSGTYKMNLVQLYDSTIFATVQMGVLLNADLTMSIYRTDHSTILGTTTFALSPSTWYYIELKWNVNNSIASGDVVLYVNGDAKLTLAAATDTQGTANAYATGYGFSGNVPTITSAGSAPFLIDDIYVDQAEATSIIGECRVITIRPSGDGNYSQFTGSDGNSTNNSLLVDESGTPNSDTDYVETSVVNNIDTYAYGDLPASVNTIYEVQLNTFAKKTDTDTRALSPVFRISSTDYVGSAYPNLTSTYVCQMANYSTSPATAAAWTLSEINGLEAGFKLTT